MKHRLPRTENAPVLAGVKATPFGWPAASLDPDSGRGPQAASGTPLHQSSKARSLRCQRIAGQAASAGGRLLTRLNGTVAFERSHHVCAGRSPVPCHVWKARGDPLQPTLQARRAPDRLVAAFDELEPMI